MRALCEKMCFMQYHFTCRKLQRLVAKSVRWAYVWVRCAKTTEPVVMPFAIQTLKCRFGAICCCCCCCSQQLVHGALIIPLLGGGSKGSGKATPNHRSGSNAPCLNEIFV